MAPEHIEVKTYFGRCRCCMNYGYLKNMWCEHYTDDGGTEIFGLMLMECFSLSWQQRKGICEQICSQCIERLREAILFKRQVQECHEKFLQLVFSEHEDQEGFFKEDMMTDEEELLVVLEDHKEESKYNVGLDHGEAGSLETVNTIKVQLSEDESQEYEQVEYLDEDLEPAPVPTEKKEQRRRKWPRKLPKADRYKTYKQYTEEDMKLAIEAAASERMTLGEAAEAYNVPEKTLKHKVRSYIENPDAENLTDQKQYKFVQEIKAVLTYTNATPYKSKAIRYYCAYCTTDGPCFEEADDLRTHTRTVHAEDRIKRINFMIRPYWMNEVLKLDIDNLMCTVCCSPLDNWNHMFKHLKQTHEIELDQAYTRMVPYILHPDMKCALCKEQFSNYLILDGHMNAHYSNYICGDCGDSFVALSRLKQHSQIHDVGRFPCEYCGKIFALKKYLKKHKDLVHTKQLRYKCKYCDEMFTGEYVRHLHVVDKHKEKVKHFTCEYCGKVFDWRQYYSSHIKKTHIKNKRFGCHLCPKKFVTNFELKNHKKTHDSKRYQCDICMKLFTNKVVLNSHMLEHIKTNPELSRCYVCELCNETFHLKSALSEHMNTHVSIVIKGKKVEKE